MDDDSFLVHVNGTPFRFHRQTLKIPRLNTKDDRTFQRPKDSFEAIYNYCTTGKLHMPFNVCPGEFIEELEFWGLKPRLLEKCCHRRYAMFVREQDNLNGFQQTVLESNADVEEKTTSTKKDLLRRRLWKMLDNKDDSAVTKIYFTVSTLFILLAIFGVAFSTLPQVHANHTGNENMASTSPPSHELMTQASLYIQNKSGEDDYSNNATAHQPNNQTKMSLFPSHGNAREKVLTMKHVNHNTRWLLYIEHATNVFFTAELILRLATCPSLSRYFRGYLNIIDTIVLVAGYSRYIVLIADITGSTNDADVLLYLQMLRVFRLLRIIENIPAFRILCYTVKLGRKDLFTMLLFLFMGTMLSSNFLYYVECNDVIRSIPDAWWFSIITMTTVGYGDIVPQTVVGKLIGSVCALSGVVFISLTIPIFVNNFQSLYLYASFQSKRHK